MHDHNPERRSLLKLAPVAAGAAAIGLTAVGTPAGASAPTEWKNIVTDYGADASGSANSGATINTAISDAAAAGGGIVYVPEGTFKIETPVLLKDHVWLVGAGSSSILKLKDGTNDWVVKVPSDVAPIGIRDLRIHGVGGNQTAGSSGGILIETSDGTTPFGGSDSYHVIENLFIHDTRGPGIRAKAPTGSNPAREARIHNVCVIRTGKDGDAQTNHGFDLDLLDSVVSDCTAASCVGHGFNITRANNRIVGAKAFYCREDGFYVSNDRNQLVGCQAQDNEGDGFELDGVDDVVVSGCLADSNQWAGIRVREANACSIEGFTSFLRSGGAQSQQFGVKIHDTTDYCRIVGVARNNSTANISIDGSGNSNGITQVLSV